MQYLADLSIIGQPDRSYIACISGRGFGFRREDMKKLFAPDRGKVFTVKQLDRLVDHMRLWDFKAR